MTTVTVDRNYVYTVIIDNLSMIAPEADFDALAPDANVREVLDIDSFDFLNFLIALEQELGVSTPEADYGLLISVNDIVSYMATRMT